MTINEKYKELSETPSDINEHLPTLKELASECNVIAELGVRTAVSDYAICSGMKEGAIFRAYDINESPEARELETLCLEAGIDYKFAIADSRTVDIGDVDMLFIDTYHNADTVFHELMNSAHKVSKYIVFHDTVLFGDKGADGDDGLLIGMNDYLQKYPEWKVKQHYENNNGLTIRERI